MLGNDIVIAYEMFLFHLVWFLLRKKQADEVLKKQKCTNGVNFIFTIIAIIRCVTSNPVKTLTITVVYSKGANWVGVGFKFS